MGTGQEGREKEWMKKERKGENPPKLHTGFSNNNSYSQTSNCITYQ